MWARGAAAGAACGRCRHRAAGLVHEPRQRAALRIYLAFRARRLLRAARAGLLVRVQAALRAVGARLAPAQEEGSEASEALGAASLPASPPGAA